MRIRSIFGRIQIIRMLKSGFGYQLAIARNQFKHTIFHITQILFTLNGKNHLKCVTAPLYCKHFVLVYSSLHSQSRIRIRRKFCRSSYKFRIRPDTQNWKNVHGTGTSMFWMLPLLEMMAFLMSSFQRLSSVRSLSRCWFTTWNSPESTLDGGKSVIKPGTSSTLH